MRITKYDTRLDADRLPMLVKESSFTYGKGNRNVFDSPQKIVDFLQEAEDMGNLDVEHVYLLCLNNKCKLLGYFLISKGTSCGSLFDRKDVFIKALSVGAQNIVLAHNHPSGDPTPSSADLEVTEIIRQGAELLGFRLADHLILANNTYLSFVDQGLISQKGA